MPSPGSCPCYLVSPSESNTTAITSKPPTAPSTPDGSIPPPYGVIGFIPVIFYPYCPGDKSNPQTLGPIFPAAVQVPYPCSKCGGEVSGNSFATRYSKTLPDTNFDSFTQVLKQADLPYGSIIKSPHRRRSGTASRSRYRAKSDDVQ